MAAYASCKMKEDECTDFLHHPQKRVDEVCLHPQATETRKYINVVKKKMHNHVSTSMIELTKVYINKLYACKLWGNIPQHKDQQPVHKVDDMPHGTYYLNTGKYRKRVNP